MDTLKIADADSLMSCLVDHLCGVTAISRRWSPGHLEAHPVCRHCTARTADRCLTMTTQAVDGIDAERFTLCVRAVRQREGLPETDICTRTGGAA